jgi:TolB-like protein
MNHRMCARLVFAATGVLLCASVGPLKPLVRPEVVQAAQQLSALDAASSPDTVTVVGFFSITGAAEDVWIGEGTAEAIVAYLAGTGVSVVLARDGSTAGPLAGELVATPIPNDDASVAAGRDVGARWVVGGAFQRLGDRVRLTGHIVDVETAVVVYATTVDGAMRDLFALQDELADELRQGLPGVPEMSHRMVSPGPFWVWGAA